MFRSPDDRPAVVRQPAAQEMEFVGAGLAQFNHLATRGRFPYPGDSEPGLALELALKDADGAIVGGVSTSSVLGVMWLETLWVADDVRRRGLATWLVLEAERLAQEQGCVGAGTWTFDWQGSEFYPTIGYTLRGVYDGYPGGVTEHVLTKRFPDDATVRSAESRIARSRRDGFSLVARPTPDEMRVVRNGLRRFCVQQAGEEIHAPDVSVRLALREGAGEVVGGLVAFPTIRNLVIDGLWIDARYRGRGQGQRLVAAAEEMAYDAGCRAVSSRCLSFQSPGFFRRMGYETYGVVDVYLDGITENLLIKRL